MKQWSELPLKADDIIFFLLGILCLLFGWICIMIHIFKLQPEKVWFYRKSLLARWFINSEIRHVAENENYRFWARGAGIIALLIGTAIMIGSITNLINYIMGSGPNHPH
ncbi:MULTISPECIES: hypothetical protein [unclassified Chitinophaga]|uniref:hypothetical protein n=1 Tax=unclassified Chitinophaga TaxID=2619133 RepID=UPI0009C9225F|nr:MULTISPECIES: hypothetical protein [unclassified Chitinophaga]OMP75481.1 hypothetical protein BW716_29955 [[Flexibacter] sp. ATCC 35208]WPV65690.1 hypothetical protein QQL36_28200 [Chitinophaga sp. LS1]